MVYSSRGNAFLVAAGDRQGPAGLRELCTNIAVEYVPESPAARRGFVTSHKGFHSGDKDFLKVESLRTMEVID